MSLFKYLVLLLIAFGSVYGTTTDTQINKSWQYMGYAERKVFMAGSLQLGYAKAVEHCQKNHMQLVSIDSEAQLNALESGLFTQGLNGEGFWTSGKGAFKIRHMPWDSTNEKHADKFFNPYVMHQLTNSCIASFTANGNTKLYFRSMSCSHILRVLCEGIV